MVAGPTNQEQQCHTYKLNLPSLAAQWVAAGASEALVKKEVDIVILNLKLCGVIADLVCCPIGDTFTASGP